METTVLDKSFGKEAFGLDPAGYDSARPPYPDWVYSMLQERCGLRKGTASFEIGPGTGTATRPLTALGLNPFYGIEPDPRLADFLRQTISQESLTVVQSTFEEADLPEASFDFGFCATAFHWLQEDISLAKIARLLKPGGWWAVVWNIFGDSEQEDPFHEATKELLSGPVSPSRDDKKIPFSLDKSARVAALESTGAFDCIEHFTSKWILELDAERTVNLYATYSNINARPDRETVLAELGHIAREQFGNRVTRNMITSLFVARKKLH